MKANRLARSKNQVKEEDLIVIDAEKGLVFSSEEDLYRHFESQISQLETEFLSLRPADDLPEEDFKKYEKHLNDLLDNPDTVWLDKTTLADHPLRIFVRDFTKEGEDPLFHVAVAYVTGDTPSFVYLHFPTRSKALIEKYQRGEILFDRSELDIPIGALEGDALTENDELAVGLYNAMLLLRTRKDISEKEFRDYGRFRESAVEEADEIWRSSDSKGNVLVNFIREFTETEHGDFYYIVVTQEDGVSGSHALLFSFPTRDKTLMERYRHGENLQAEEVVQESSH